MTKSCGEISFLNYILDLLSSFIFDFRNGMISKSNYELKSHQESER